MFYKYLQSSELWSLISPFYNKVFIIVIPQVSYRNKYFSLHNDCFLYIAHLNIYLPFMCLTELIIQLNDKALYKNNSFFCHELETTCLSFMTLGRKE